jgi:thiamine-phosphate pyrophosphorylase
MTDERQGERLWKALQKLPPGSGVVFRHKTLPIQARKALFSEVRKVCRRRRLFLLLAGPSALARRWRADGSHGGAKPVPGLLRTASVHDLTEIRTAERAGADLLFLSPVFPTRSHPGAKPLGRTRFALLAGKTRLPVVALGGMDERRARTLAGAYGWAGIDAWSG